MRRGLGRWVVGVSCAIALLALCAAPAFAVEKHQVNDESLGLAESLASFFGPRSAPADTVNPSASRPR
jgi:hypothetical protein